MPSALQSSIFDDYDSYDIMGAYISGVISATIIPVQLLVLKTIYTYSGLWNNASYRLLFRLIVIEFLQSICLVFTSLFTLIPRLLRIEILRRTCGVVLSTFFLIGFVLMSELSIFRILVVSKRCQSEQLPMALVIVEALSYVILLLFSIPVYMNESMKFEYGDWIYDEHDIYATILDKAELFFCIPVLFLTYVVYLFLIALIYGKRRNFSGGSSNGNNKQEWLLFVQSTFITVYYAYLIADWHFIDVDPWEIRSLPLDIFNNIVWGTAFYWTSLLLLLFNKSVRSKIFYTKTVIMTTTARV